MSFNNWSTEKTLQFIHLLKENPILWNKIHPQYNNKRQREAIWQILAKEMDSTIKTLKAKVKSIRTSYRAECKKIEKNPNYKPFWRFYPLLKFLDDYYSTETETNVDVSLNENSKVIFYPWSDEKTIKFINLYKDSPLLWNKKHSDYLVREKRELILLEIGNELECTTKVLKIKIKSLRTNYLSEKNKIIKNPNYKPVWRFFTLLKFLDDDDNDEFEFDHIIEYDGGEEEEVYNNDVSLFAWNDEEIIDFINLLKIYPQLWNKDHEDYTNKQQTETNWSNLAQQLGRSIIELKDQYHKLRQNCRVEYLEMQKTQNYKPAWQFFAQLEFLINELNKNKSLMTYNMEFSDDSEMNEFMQNSFMDIEANEEGGIEENNVLFQEHNEINSVWWGDEKTLKFINLIRDCPTLWDENSSDFKNVEKKRKCLQKITIEMFSTMDIVKAKYKRLTGTYRAEYRKALNNPKYKPLWKFFPYLSFLTAKNNDKGNYSDIVHSRLNLTSWNDEKILKFIDLIGKAPTLWNKKLEKYTDKEEKDIIWHNIAFEMNIHVNLLKSKLKTLRTMYRAECKKIEQNPNYKPIWRFFSHMKLLYGENDDKFWPEMSREKTDFTDEKILTLLSYVKDNPTLWDKNHAKYKDNDERDIIWHNIAFEMNSDVKTLKSRYNTIRITYRLECRKMERNPLYKTAWRFFPYVKFIYGENEDDIDPEMSKLIATKQSTGKNKNDEEKTYRNWEDEKTLKYINLLRQYPKLWNEKDPEFKLRGKRQEIFEQLALEMDTSVEVLQRKYKFLCGNYRTEYRKMLKYPNYKPSWKFFNDLDFLTVEDKSTGKTRTTITINKCDNVEEEEDTSSIFYYESDRENSIDSASNDDGIDHYGMQKTKAIEGIEKYNQFQNKTTITDENFLIKGANVHQQQKCQVQDECTVFGEYIANELRKMKDHKFVALTFKSKILRAVLEANEAINKS